MRTNRDASFSSRIAPPSRQPSRVQRSLKIFYNLLLCTPRATIFPASRVALSGGCLWFFGLSTRIVWRQHTSMRNSVFNAATRHVEARCVAWRHRFRFTRPLIQPRWCTVTHCRAFYRVWIIRHWETIDPRWHGSRGVLSIWTFFLFLIRKVWNGGS